MVGHLVPKEDQNWKNFLLLLQIVDYLLAPTVTVDECSYLQILIEEHHQEFVKLYPDSNVTPKMHYMVHMLRIMLK